MISQEVHVVTGAFGYSGQWITRRLLDRGCRVRTLTNSPRRANTFGDAVTVEPFRFDDPPRLADSLAGAAILYNTYWVRFNHRNFKFADAVRNTRLLFDAARRAGIERIVHVSITNPSLDSPLEYFRGKAEIEEMLRGSGISHAILRPAVLFGPRPEDSILINNIAWMIRRLPAVGVFGSGDYRLRPIHVEDLADLAVAHGTRRDNVTIDAVGPESFTYRELVETLGRVIGHHPRIMSVPPWFGYLAATALGKVLGDVIVTRDEITGLMANLLSVDSPAAGRTRLTAWAQQNATELGRRYASELARRRL